MATEIIADNLTSLLDNERIIATLAHELRTPLTPALSAIKALENVQMAPEGTILVEIARRNIELLGCLIEDMLDHSYAVHGQVELKTNVVNLHNVIDQVVQICRKDAEQHRTTLDVLLLAPDHYINGDEVRLHQVFWNLLRNAIAYTPPEGSIRVRTHNADNGILIEVADTGIGIDLMFINTMFDPFVRQKHSSNTVGLGLGLTICRTMVDLHNGTIWAHSDGVGHGSVFTVQLPVLSTVPKSVHELA